MARLGSSAADIETAALNLGCLGSDPSCDCYWRRLGSLALQSRRAAPAIATVTISKPSQPRVTVIRVAAGFRVRARWYPLGTNTPRGV
jgi:hypothetical protein